MLNCDLPGSVVHEFDELFDGITQDLIPEIATQSGQDVQEVAEELGVLLVRMGLSVALGAESMQSDSLQLMAERFVIEQKFERS